jgi:hypothetical protein
MAVQLAVRVESSISRVAHPILMNWRMPAP